MFQGTAYTMLTKPNAYVVETSQQAYMILKGHPQKIKGSQSQKKKISSTGKRRKCSHTRPNHRREIS